jgi:hypothetical protein
MDSQASQGCLHKKHHNAGPVTAEKWNTHLFHRLFLPPFWRSLAFKQYILGGRVLGAGCRVPGNDRVRGAGCRVRN